MQIPPKLFTVLILCLFFCQKVNAQEEKKDIPISVSYLGHVLIQPGIKIGTQFPIKKWETLDSDVVQNHKVFLSPQIGIFSRINNNTNYLFNLEIGKTKRNDQRYFYSSYSFGLGYMLQAELLSFSVDLGSGDKSAKEKEILHYIMPTLNYRLGGKVNDKIEWFTKFSIGSKFSGSRESEMVLFFELGTQISLKKKSN